MGSIISTCYGAPFMPRHPQRYAELLGKKLDTHDVEAWIINTGWSGCPYGVGDRIKIPYTRAMVNAVLDGKLKDVPLEKEPFFGLQVPKHCPDVPDEILNPRNTWSNPADYDAHAQKLAKMFAENFKQYADQATPDILAAGPSA